MIFTLIITSLYMIAIISPGPDFFIVTKNALIYSRRMAILTAVGVSLGVAIHTSYSVFALTYIKLHSHYLLNVIRYLGAAYLIYLGGRGLLEKNVILSTSTEQTLPHLSSHKALLHGFLCNLLNPKAVLFFISIFTFITESQVPLAQRAWYGIEMVALTLIWFVSLVYLITMPSILHRLTRIQVKLIKVLSFLLLLIGFYLLFC